MIWGFIIQIIFFTFVGVEASLLTDPLWSLYVGFAMCAIGNALVFQPCMA